MKYGHALTVGRYWAYDPAMIPGTADARRALDDGQFFPFFQPLVALRSGQLSGFEVLARWKHPDLGLISPNMFIPLAERDGWIDDLTHVILRQAFTEGKAIPSSLRLSGNLSPLQLRNSTLPEEIQSIAEQTGFSLDRVVIEITETALAENPHEARDIAIRLKALGCKIGLDDFGTGYSSLRHLQSLPFDELKVDRSFVSSMTERRESRKIVAAVIGLGQSLGLTTIAEGIETQDQADMLLWLGCDIGQGWLYGKPIPAEELSATIAAPRPRATTSAQFRWKNLAMGNLEGLPSQRLAQLQAVYDGAPVGLGFLDRNLRYINLNQKLADMHGIPLADHIGRTVSDMTGPSFAQIEPLLRRALQGDALSDVEVNQSPSPLGNDKTFLASYQPARDEAGDVVGVSCAVVDFTARKRAEERLRQYERMVESLDEMIAVVDRNYRYVLANRAFLRYHGLEADKVIGHSAREVPGNVFDVLVKEKLGRCLAGSSVHFEMRYKYPQVGERDLTVSYVPIETDGEVTGAACIFRDVTDLKRMEQAEYDWRKRIELAQQAGLRIGLWDWNVKDNTVIWSDETYRQWGFTRDTFSGCVEDALPRIHFQDRARVETAIQKVLSAETDSYSEVYRIVRPDGTTSWIDAHGVLVHGESNHFLGVGVDVTHLKAIQESLQESEEKYRLLLNSTAEAIYGLDLEGNCTFCNPACLRLLGYEHPEDLLGKNMHWLIHHTRPDGTPYPINECLIFKAIRQGTESYTADEVFLRADGTNLPIEYWSYPIRKDGNLVGAVVTFLDISERIQAEEARRSSESRYRELFEHATYGIFCSREDGTLIDVNPAIVKMLGYDSKAELLQRNLNTDVYADPKTRRAILEDIAIEGHLDVPRTQWKRKDGAIITVRLSGRMVQGKVGLPGEMEVIVENITSTRARE